MDTLKLEGPPDESEAQVIARYFLSTGTNAGMTIQQAGVKLLPLEINPLIDELARQSKAVNSRDLSGGQTMLVQQAATLDALFHKLARYGLRCMEEGYPEAAERYMRLGFKAQSQCRSNWEAIAEIQNPRAVAFIKADQANVAAGHQQINNIARAESENTPSKLNEVEHERTMDTRSQTPAIGVDPAVAALGTIDGATIARGQGDGLEERIQGRRARAAARVGKAAAGDLGKRRR
ncbi:MAG: hypothetical protein ACR2G6_01350 [Gemmatimonadaceae bacterium]